MAIDSNMIKEQIKLLERLLHGLGRQSLTDPEMSAGHRLIVEGSLVACVPLTFDVANHILTNHYGLQPKTYQESLEMLYEREILPFRLYHHIRWLSGFRNILQGKEADKAELMKNYEDAILLLWYFSRELLAWLKEYEKGGIAPPLEPE